MSSSLLKKSLKLFEETEKGPKPAILKKGKKQSKKKKLLKLSESNRDEFVQKNLENNLKAIKLLNHYSVSKEVSQKIIQHVTKSYIPLEDKEFDEPTAFTEADFEAFEKEYQVD